MIKPSAGVTAAFFLAAACIATAATDAQGRRILHVSAARGEDTNTGAVSKPFKTITGAAQVAMPGDTILVHAGMYRERVTPPRGGTSDALRITYAAAPGEKVTITGSDPVKWTREQGETWKAVLPNSYFGAFNPFAEKIHGDWYTPHFRVHRGGVFLGHDTLAEARSLAEVMASKTPVWFATVDGVVEPAAEYLFNVASFKVGDATVQAAASIAKNGTQTAPCAEGGECVGWINDGSWLRFDDVDFGREADHIAIRASAPNGAGGDIEVRLDKADGELLGTCPIGETGDWQKWSSFEAKIKPVSGKQTLCLVFKPHAAPKGNDETVIHAQFPGVDPNIAEGEISVRPTVFTPEKTNIDYITVRGFDLRNAATNWAPPTAGQVGLVSAYWCKGWIIEGNEISNSRCSGVALGKYSDQWDGKRGTTEGYYLTIADAYNKDGWRRDNIGHHLVRRNHIHHCGQTGVVGSLGCAFSRIEGNDIHDIHWQQPFGGAEMAGIKFHGAIDVVIANNHIWRCGEAGGIWLDWMAQGTQITGNLFHDNQGHDLFTEVDHGPFFVANNLFLSPVSYLANSRGGAFAHNLMTGRLDIIPDGRQTPFMKPHSTEQVALHGCPVGDLRWYNNLMLPGTNLNTLDGASLPVAAAGNVFVKGAPGSKHDQSALLKKDFDPKLKLTRKDDGWYLSLVEEPSWKSGTKRPLVTTALLGKATVPNQAFENADGSPLAINTDYFGGKRNAANLFPGPFETPVVGEIKVWPK
jgi:hypothetical protein